jgi:hypothetical protein
VGDTVELTTRPQKIPRLFSGGLYGLLCIVQLNSTDTSIDMSPEVTRSVKCSLRKLWTHLSGSCRIYLSAGRVQVVCVRRRTLQESKNVCDGVSLSLGGVDPFKNGMDNNINAAAP